MNKFNIDANPQELIELTRQMSKNYTRLNSERIYVAKVSPHEVFLNLDFKHHTVCVMVNYDKSKGSFVSLRASTIFNGKEVEFGTKYKNEVTPTLLAVLANTSEEFESIQDFYSFVNDLTHFVYQYNRTKKIVSDKSNQVTIISEFGLMQRLTWDKLYGTTFCFDLDRTVGKDRLFVHPSTLFNLLAFHMIDDNWMYSHAQFSLLRLREGLIQYFGESIADETKGFFKELQTYVDEELAEINPN